jgi:hypothetical protein
MSEETPVSEDIYAAQRDELMKLLKRLSAAHEPLVVHGRPALVADEVMGVLTKIRRDFGFSRKERMALTEAGFDLENLFPKL